MAKHEELLGVALPIIQAPMASCSGSALAAAVCNADGLGSLSCGLLDLAGIRRELDALMAATSRPYNVNFPLRPPAPSHAGTQADWRVALALYYEEMGLDVASAPASFPISPVMFSSEVVDLLEEYRLRVVSFHFSLPDPALVRRMQSWGAKVLSSATTVEEGLWLEARGVDGVIAQGLEAGGHGGSFLTDDLTRQLGTLVLVPQVATAVRAPVVAAGGIVDARGDAAAVAHGATTVQVGTRYLLYPGAF